MNTHDALWSALTVLPKPVTRDAALTAAQGVLDGKQLAGFMGWLDKNEAYLLGRLNG